MGHIDHHLPNTRCFFETLLDLVPFPQCPPSSSATSPSSPPPPPLARHHVALITAHLHFFEALGRAFPIPDVEFIIATFDVPTIRLDRVPPGQPPVPLLRFCKSDAHADILVPYIHFQV